MKYIALCALVGFSFLVNSCKTTNKSDSALLDSNVNLDSISGAIQSLTCSSDWTAEEIQAYVQGYLTSFARFNNLRNLMLLRADAKISVINSNESPKCTVQQDASFKVAVQDLARERVKVYKQSLEVIKATPNAVVPPDQFVVHGIGNTQTRYIGSEATLQPAVYWSFGYYDAFLDFMKFDLEKLSPQKATLYKAHFKPQFTSDLHAVYFEAVNELAKKDRTEKLEILNFRVTKVVEKAIEAVAR